MPPPSDNSRVERVLVYLPSPMGDAILATPALRRLRNSLPRTEIYFLGGSVVREVLWPTPFCDEWLTIESKSPFRTAVLLRKHRFDRAILFSNSFRSALTCFLAGIQRRVGYARGGRGPLLTERHYAPRINRGPALARGFAPRSMVDYYLELACETPGRVEDRRLELHVDAAASEQLASILPEAVEPAGPLIILVPGGAFGPSKCWLPERFAETADRLIGAYNALVVISVANNQAEREIARAIQSAGENTLVNLADTGLSLSQLKALYSRAELVITNDTGPRHIAIALRRKVITLFGPNDPAWTETGYEGEIKIVANVSCAPCAKPECPKPEHVCMRSLTVEQVVQAAERLLESPQRADLSE